MHQDQDQQHDGKIFGLHSPDNGRSCNLHVCCGRHVVPGHIVRFKREVQEIIYQVPGDSESDARIETVIKAVLVLDDRALYHWILTKACGCKTSRSGATAQQVCSDN